ncbi:MAG: DUF4411 family protein [Gemmatimonadales bacterium]|nr:DUF4411 family protein [Gemmatimonadales bacterium]
MAYLLDANVFIQAKKMHYGFDFCTAYWDWLDREGTSGHVVSIDKVRDEIEAGGDELAAWVKARRDMFPPLGPETLPHLAAVAAWVQSRSYSQAAIAAFLQEADYYLIGRALAHTDIIVTSELPAPGSKNNVKIPDVCIGVGVTFMNPFQMLRTEQARFVLAA